MDVWGPHNPVQFLGLYLWLTELHQLQNISFQAVVFGSGISEDVDKGSRQRNLQGLLYGSDTHLRTVAPTLCDRISHDQLVLEKNSKYHIWTFLQLDFTFRNNSQSAAFAHFKIERCAGEGWGPTFKTASKTKQTLERGNKIIFPLSNNTSISNYCCFRIHFLFFIHPNLTVASKLKVLARTLSEGGARAQPWVEGLNNFLLKSIWHLRAYRNLDHSRRAARSPFITLFRGMLQRCFALKLQNCFVDDNTFLFLVGLFL